MVTEIGGTVGEYQNILFLEAVRILKLKASGRPLVLVSFLPTVSDGGELKNQTDSARGKNSKLRRIAAGYNNSQNEIKIDDKRKKNSFQLRNEGRRRRLRA